MSSAARWLPLVAACIGVWIVSSMSHPPVPALGFQHADKLLHFLGYTVLGALAFYSVRDRGWPRESLIAWAFVVVFGLSDEWHQSYVPGRDASLGDATADALGGAVGVAAVGWWFTRRGNRKGARAQGGRAQGEAMPPPPTSDESPRSCG
jgi:VanZ family protein